MSASANQNTPIEKMKYYNKEITKALPSKQAMIVVYCGSAKCPLSGQLAAKLSELGYENIVEYRPGIKGWKEAGGAIEKE